MPALLEIRDLQVRYPGLHGEVRALNGIDLDIAQAESVGIVGESGSGKTQLLLALLGLQGHQAQVSGSIRYRGQELLHANANTLNAVRGRHIGMIFQDPMSALNPYLTIGTQLMEGARLHLKLARAAAERRAIELLNAVHIPEPALRLRQYPHELSGGMRQRVMIAMALIAEPELLLADEPTTALDVTVQAQILEVLREVRRERGIAIVWVTHDLGVVAAVAERVCVMYAGRIVEHSPVQALFAAPRHPYSAGLQRSIPRLDQPLPSRLPTIGGQPPNAAELPPGCAFAPRCSYRQPRCEQEPPALRTLPEAGRSVACWHEGPLAEPLAAVGPGP